MTIAEIHGKLSAYEQMEDLLTSDVFSTFKYLPVDHGLIPFLKKATSFHGNLPPDFLTDIVEADYVFWPRTTNLKREPDVLIILTKKDDSTIAILVEAKYHSGKSNARRDNEVSERLDHLEGDQLAELYKELLRGNIYIPDPLIRNKYIRSEGNRYLFFVTAHYASPKKDIEETFNVLEKKSWNHSHNKNFFWVNWISITDVIDEILTYETWKHAPTMRYLLEDLKTLLQRKGLVPFSGFSKPQKHLSKPLFYFWEKDVKVNGSLFQNIQGGNLVKKHHYYPYMLQRVFTKEKDSKRGIGVNSTFDASSNGLENKIPFLTCGVLEFSDGKATKGNGLYWAGWTEHPEVEIEPNDKLSTTTYNDGVITKSYFLPIEILNNQEKVEQYIIKPLIQLNNGNDDKVNDMIAAVALDLVDIVK